MISVYIIGFLILIYSLAVFFNQVLNNFIGSIFIALVSYMSVISILAFLLALIDTRMSIWLIIVIQLIIGAILFYYLKKEKLKMNYKNNLQSFIVSTLIFIFTIFVTLIQYGKDLIVKFETTDPAVHFLFAKYFSETGQLLTKINELIPYKHMSDYPFFSYVNNGLVMMLFEGYFDNKSMYIIWNMFIYFGIVFLSFKIIEQYVSKQKYVLVILTLMLIGFGHSFNAIVFGFTSQNAGVLLVLSIIYCTYYMHNRYIKLAITVLFIGLFYSYYYFIPAAWFSMVIYSYYLDRKFEKTKFNATFSNFNITLTITQIVFGGIYLYVLVDSTTSTSLANEGYIYRDLFNGFVLLIPIIIYYLISLKKDSIKILEVFLINFSLFSLVIFLLGMFGKSSSYYFYKNHYIISILITIIFNLGIYKLLNENKKLYKAYVSSVVTIFIFSIFIDPKIKEANFLFNPVPNSYTESIYGYNYHKLFEDSSILDNDELTLINYVNENYDIFIGSEKYIVVFGDTLELLWFYSITEVWPKYSEENLGFLYEEQIDLSNWLSNESKNPYVVILGEEDKQRFIESTENSINYEVIYSVGEAEIIKIK